jgi:hypothetical protein
VVDFPPTVAPGSARVRLAALALEAARAVDGVVAADAGPNTRHITTSGSTTVLGVLVVAESGGGYSIDLGLQARLVPLGALADAVRTSVVGSITRAGLGDLLGPVSVTFHDIAGPAALSGP